MTVKGYVYVLEVKDLSLPICKIGMTTRTPNLRCSEINKSSTGDLLWQVDKAIYVDDCRELESLLHRKLAKYRQSGREIFQMKSSKAFEILENLLTENPNINQIDSPVESSKEIVRYKSLKNQGRVGPCALLHEDLDDIYRVFRDRLGVEGKTFGQAGREVVGLSDNNSGVQWNLAVWKDTGNVTLGINLEGMKYADWPILKFISNEIENPSIETLLIPEFNIDEIEVVFTRDAWQVASRPRIKEKKLIYSNTPLSSWTNKMWMETLSEAKECLDIGAKGVSRGVQKVTVLKKNGSSEVKEMSVSPHLGIRLVVFNMADRETESVVSAIEEGFRQLGHIYSWVAERT
jgi:hypothetical protein